MGMTVLLKQLETPGFTLGVWSVHHSNCQFPLYTDITNDDRLSLCQEEEHEVFLVPSLLSQDFSSLGYYFLYPFFCCLSRDQRFLFIKSLTRASLGFPLASVSLPLSILSQSQVTFWGWVCRDWRLTERWTIVLLRSTFGLYKGSPQSGSNDRPPHI